MSDILLAALIVAVVMGLAWAVHRWARRRMGEIRYDAASSRVMHYGSPILGEDKILEMARQQREERRNETKNG